MTPTIFANLVLLAQQLRESSWDGKGYKLSEDEAAQKACGCMQQDPAWAQPVSLLNITAINDVQIWAKEIGAVLSEVYL